MNEEERQRVIIDGLSARINENDRNANNILEKLHEVCNVLREKIDEMEKRINETLEREYTPEDDRLQIALSEITLLSTEDESDFQLLLRKAQAELLVKKTYILEETKMKEKDLLYLYKLRTKKEILPEWVYSKKPEVLDFRKYNLGGVYIGLKYLNAEEERILSENNLKFSIKHTALLKKKDYYNNDNYIGEYTINDHGGGHFSFFSDLLDPTTRYSIQVKSMFENQESEWGDPFEFTTQDFRGSVWRKDPIRTNAFVIDKKNPRVVSLTRRCKCVVLGNITLPPNKVSSWYVKVLKSRDNNGGGIQVGILQYDGFHDAQWYYNRKWCYDCYYSVLDTGCFQNNPIREYGPRKGDGQYVHMGDSVGVVMDMSKGDLSFSVNGVSYGTAYYGIPLDKPLVPCVVLHCYLDSVELIF